LKAPKVLARRAVVRPSWCLARSLAGWPARSEAHAGPIVVCLAVERAVGSGRHNHRRGLCACHRESCPDNGWAGCLEAPPRGSPGGGRSRGQPRDPEPDPSVTDVISPARHRAPEVPLFCTRSSDVSSRFPYRSRPCKIVGRPGPVRRRLSVLGAKRPAPGLATSPATGRTGPWTNDVGMRWTVISGRSCSRMILSWTG
jgi:hypothetical protein